MSIQYQIKVIKDLENKVLNRRELILRIDHINYRTPTRAEVRELVSSAFKVPINLVIVRKLRTLTGTNVTEAHIHVYKDEKTLHEVEPEHIKLRNFGKKEEEKKEEQP
ncbi:MAG: 30S ribosomal protein S24e [Thermoprotei archaeon]|nr:MAG: 30S ribosomal protein S24e [Thermoprotei archaeon]RLF22657.1 MAG: 30S ribosomal protein S24e [Thermoprotei archaeon]